jgi:hypothetical protein
MLDMRFETKVLELISGSSTIYYNTQKGNPKDEAIYVERSRKVSEGSGWQDAVQSRRSRVKKDLRLRT